MVIEVVVVVHFAAVHFELCRLFAPFHVYQDHGDDNNQSASRSNGSGYHTNLVGPAIFVAAIASVLLVDSFQFDGFAIENDL